MNKKGFTLVEMLAVITLIALIIGITVPLVNKVKEKMANKNLETKMSTYQNAANLWAQNNSQCFENSLRSGCELIQNSTGSCQYSDGIYSCEVSLEDLADNNIINYDENDKIINPNDSSNVLNKETINLKYYKTKLNINNLIESAPIDPEPEVDPEPIDPEPEVDPEPIDPEPEVDPEPQEDNNPTIKSKNNWYNTSQSKLYAKSLYVEEFDNFYSASTVNKIIFTKEKCEDKCEDKCNVWNATDNKSTGLITVCEDEINKTIYISSNGADKIYANSDSTAMFNEFVRLKEIEGLNMLDTKNVVSMRAIFGLNINLTSLDLSNFNTSNVKDMINMFSGCKNLTSINGLNKFDTVNVNNMHGMFNYCESISEIDLSGFNTKGVKSMQAMFQGTHKLKKIIWGSNFDTSSVTDMRDMFALSNMESLDLTNFDTSSVVYMSQMFLSSNMELLDLTSFTNTSLKYASRMFDGMRNLKTIYASNDFTLDSKFGNVFRYCTSLVGGTGNNKTVFDSSKINGLYGRVNTESTKGYFTLKTS